MSPDATCEGVKAIDECPTPLHGAENRSDSAIGAPRLPAIVVFSALFPSSVQPLAGIFIRERMFRVRRHAPLIVVSPQPWFPFQSIVRRFFPNYRPQPPRSEIQDGVVVHFPRFLSLPGFLRRLDGISMALCAFPLMRRLCRESAIGLVDAHFAYPAGYAGVLLGRWMKLPVSVTLRGTEKVHLKVPSLRAKVVRAAREADRVFSVSDALRKLLIDEGIAAEKIHVIGNGVDVDTFKPIDRAVARRELGLEDDAPMIVSIGGLVERKGFHRVIEILPTLVGRFPRLHYLIVGGASPAGDMTTQLKAQVRDLGLEANVTFTGPLPPGRLCGPLSAADVFVLATRYEGWANVFLEAMACGLPVVTTRVGGNAEVVCSPELGTLVPFGDKMALSSAIENALTQHWDRQRIIRHARENAWDQRIATLVWHFRELTAGAPGTTAVD